MFIVVTPWDAFANYIGKKISSHFEKIFNAFATGGNFRSTFRFDGRLETKKLLLLYRNSLLFLKKTLLKRFHLALFTSKHRGKKLAITWPKHSMKEALTETNKAQVLIAADVSIAATLSRLENVRVQLELIQEDTNNLREDFKEISDRICTLAASCQEQGLIILKRRSKA